MSGWTIFLILVLVVALGVVLVNLHDVIRYFKIRSM
jgi:hypothetical protein